MEVLERTGILISASRCFSCELRAILSPGTCRVIYREPRPTTPPARPTAHHNAAAMAPLTVAVAQYATRATRAESLALLASLAHSASSKGAHLLLFPEAFLGGYPRSTNFGALIGSRSTAGRSAYYSYWQSAIDLGDACPEGTGDYRNVGDGTRSVLEDVARNENLFLVVGMIEKSGGSLWCAVVYVDPEKGVVGKRRKVMPTGAERVVWGMGSTKTLKAVTAVLAGQKVVLAAAICWENYMPLLRTALYSQGVTLYLAPTADARPGWLATLQHIALEGRCFVFGCNQFVRRRDLPPFVRELEMEEKKKAGDTSDTSEGDVDLGEEVMSNGGSAVFDPLGNCLAGPLWGEEGMLVVPIEDVERSVVRAKMDFDAAVGGHYSRYVPPRLVWKMVSP